MSDVAKRQTPPPSTLTEPKLTREPREYHHGRSPASWIGSMTALVGGIVGTIVVALFLPLVKLIQSVSGGGG